MFERVLNAPLQLYLFHPLQLKKCEDKAYEYQSVQRFIREYTYVKHITDFDSLELSQKTQFQNPLIYQKLLQTKHFCNIFPTITHRFHRPYFFD